MSTVAKNDSIIRKLLKSGLISVRLDGDVYYKGKLCRSKSDKGYLVLSIWDHRIMKGTGRKRAKVLLHRLVYQALYGTLRKDMVINHKDRDTSNNYPLNLEMLKQHNNMKHWHKDEKRRLTRKTLRETMHESEAKNGNLTGKIK